MTQHETIFQLHKESSDGWVCGNAYRDSYIFSSHKRRGEMSYSHKDYQPLSCHQFKVDHFEDRKCAHGHRGVRDYKIITSGKPEIVKKFEGNCAFCQFEAKNGHSFECPKYENKEEMLWDTSGDALKS